MDLVVENDKRADRQIGLRIAIEDPNGVEVERWEESGPWVPKATGVWGFGTPGELYTSVRWAVPDGAPPGTYAVNAFVLSEDKTQECDRRLAGATFTVLPSDSPLIVSASPPEAYIHVTTGYSRTFSASASDSNNDLSEALWRVVDGEEVIEQQDLPPAPAGSFSSQLTHTFASPGLHAVDVTFKDKGGRSHSFYWVVDVSDPAEFCRIGDGVLICGYASEWAHDGYAPSNTAVAVTLSPASEPGGLRNLEIFIRDQDGLAPEGSLVVAVPRSAWVNYVGITKSIDTGSGVWSLLTPLDEKKNPVLPGAAETVRDLALGEIPLASAVMTTLGYFGSLVEDLPTPDGSVFKYNNRNCYSQVTVGWYGPPGMKGIRVSIPVALLDDDFVAAFAEFNARRWSEDLQRGVSLLVPGGAATSVLVGTAEFEHSFIEVQDVLNSEQSAEPPACVAVQRTDTGPAPGTSGTAPSPVQPQSETTETTQKPVSGDAETDKKALMALYNLAGGQNWKNRTNWLSEAPVWEWAGVTADHNGRVTAIQLPNNNLSGEIPAELGSMSNLTHLYLYQNQLSGEIPAELGSMSNLTHLYLYQNLLSGEIPAELGSMSSLTHLRLHINRLSGEIPGELGNLTSLLELNLQQNQLSGEIPGELGNLDNLQALHLYQNRLSGEIPAELGKLTTLRELFLHNNQLSGQIPAELGGMTSLVRLFLNNNELGGELDDLTALTKDLISLTDLYVSQNHRLGGCKPRLHDVPVNDFHTFNLPICPVSADATTARDALVALYNLAGGQNWKNRTNWLSEAPVWEWAGVTADHNGRVTAIQLPNNNLSGEIPAELGSMSNLTHLYLYQNQLSGEIPAELGSMSNLTHLYLYQNLLSGEIPAELGSMSSLTHLRLHINRLSGEIPGELGNLTSLLELNLQQNQLSGEIPGELGNLDNLQALHLYQNRLSGEIPAELGKLTTLRELFLHNNQLSGQIPAELGGMTSLVRLFLNNNELGGELDDLTALTKDLISLTDLYVSQNHRLGGCKPRLHDVPVNDFHTFNLPICPVSADATTARDALVALYNLAGGQNWKNRTNWLSEAPVWEWAGVTADHNGRVTAIQLPNNNLSGEIPAELGSMSNLTHLYLYQNQLSGEIPAELGSMSNLTHLYLYQNLLSGEIPAELGSMSSLTHLRLHINRLSGEIPGELGNLTSLLELNLQQNQLSGEIPGELGNLDNLQALHLYQNRLSGEIPAELGKLTTLRELFLHNNQLSGQIPAELGGMTSLVRLFLNNNELGGELDDLTALTKDLISLTDLYVSQNHRLGGCKPRLHDVPVNDFHTFNLPICPVSADATTARDALVALYNLAGGQNWKNRTNWLSEAPVWEWAGVTADHSGRVTAIQLPNNNLSGEIPAELGSMSNLTHLYLYQNQLSGEIPAELGSMSNLTHLYLYQNLLSGEIPAELGSMSSLTHLRLHINRLSGEIPGELGNLTSLLELNLQQNQLSGEIPGELGNLDNLQALHLNHNRLSGEIPAELGKLTTLRELHLNNNQLGVPAELGNLSNLTHLYLSQNQLKGCIPELPNVPNNDLSQLGLSPC